MQCWFDTQNFVKKFACIILLISRPCWQSLGFEEHQKLVSLVCILVFLKSIILNFKVYSFIEFPGFNYSQEGSFAQLFVSNPLLIDGRLVRTIFCMLYLCIGAVYISKKEVLLQPHHSEVIFIQC